jgi:PAS domain S-box-containing protein
MAAMLKRRQISGFFFLLLALAIVAGIVIQVWWAVQQDRRTTLDAEYQNGLVAVRLLEEHATQIIKEGERNLDTVVHAILFAGKEKTIDDTLIRAVLTKAQPFNKVLKALQFVNTKGVASVSSIDYPAYQTDADDRTYIPYLLTHPEVKKTILGRPFQRFYDAELVVPVARNMFAEDGRYLGIISTDISVSYFSAVYARVAKDSHAMVSLFTGEGIVIVRYPFDVSYVGKDISSSTIINSLQSRSEEGAFQDYKFLDETSTLPRVYTYRKIPDFGIVSVFARDLDSILAAWRERSKERIIFAAATIFFLSLLILFLWLQIRRLYRSEDSLRASEASLRLSEAKFIHLFEHSPVPLALLRLRDEQIVEINDGLLKQWAFTRNEVIGKTPLELSIWEDFSARIPYQALLKSQNYVDQLEVRMRGKHGVTITCLLSARLFESEGEKMVIFSPIDISRLREIENQIRGLNAQLEERVGQRTQSLEQKNQELHTALTTLKSMQVEMFRSEKMAALGYLVAGISHELNTPIGNGLMIATTLQEHADQLTRELANSQPRRSILANLIFETKKGADILVMSLQRAAQLISGFKQVSVDQSSNTRRIFDLRKVTEEVLMTLEPIYRRSSHKVEADIEADITMDSYPGALTQILTNLINNALSHAFENKTGGLVRLVINKQNEDQVKLVFSDNGIGIPPENLPRVFDPFFTTKLGQGGSGLGMNIVYNLVTDELGGEISIQSEKNIGTTLTILIPLIAPRKHKEA